MPVSMMFVKCPKFYNKTWQINAQTQLVSDDEIGLTEGEGQLSIIPTEEIINFGKSSYHTFKVDYDYKNITTGFVFDQKFSYYFKNYKFNIYHEPTEQILILTVKKDVSKSLIKELSKEKIDNKNLYSFKNLDINFDKIVKKAENISGLWTQIDRTNVHSQAYFGENINYDAEVKMILKERKTSYVIFESQIGGVYHKIGITKNGNVVLYNSFKEERDQLRVASLIYEMFLKD